MAWFGGLFGKQGDGGQPEPELEPQAVDYDGLLRELLEQVREQWLAGEVESALASVNEVVLLSPRLVVAWEWKAQILQRLGKYAEEIETNKRIQVFLKFENGVVLQDFKDTLPIIKTAEDLFEQGSQLMESGRFEESIESYEKAIRAKPDAYQAWHNRGVALERLGHYEESVASYDNALKFRKDKYEIWYSRSVSLNHSQKYEDSISSFEKAIQIEPGCYLAWNDKGIALAHLGRHEQALNSFEESVKINPSYHKAWKNKGCSLNKLGCYEESLFSFRKSIKMKPDDHEAWHNNGLSLLSIGAFKEALESFDKAIELKDWAVGSS